MLRFKDKNKFHVEIMSEDDFVNISCQEAHQDKCVHMVALIEQKLGHTLEQKDLVVFEKKTGVTKIILQVFAITRIATATYTFFTSFMT